MGQKWIARQFYRSQSPSCEPLTALLPFTIAIASMLKACRCLPKSAQIPLKIGSFDLVKLFLPGSIIRNVMITSYHHMVFWSTF